MPSYRVLLSAPDDARPEYERVRQVVARLGMEFKPRVDLEISFSPNGWKEGSKPPSIQAFDLVICVLRQSPSFWGREAVDSAQPSDSNPPLRPDVTGQIPDFLVFVYTASEVPWATSAMTPVVSPWKAIELLLREWDQREFAWENHFTTSVNSYSDLDQLETTLERLLRHRIGQRYPVEFERHTLPEGDALVEPDHFVRRFGSVASREVLAYVNEWLTELRMRWRRERRGVALAAFLTAATLATVVTFGAVTFSRFHQSQANLAIAKAQKRDAETVAQVSVDARIRLEQLVHEIVGDLGEKLKPVRRVDLLDPSLKALEAYQAKVGAKDNDPWVPNLRVNALDDQGDLVADEGKLDAAVAAYEEACDILERMVQQNPPRDEWVTNWAENLLKIGDIFSKEGKLVDAIKSYERAAGLWQKMVDGNRNDPVPRNGLVKTLAKLTSSFMAQKDWVAARVPLEKQRDIVLAAADQDPLNAAGWQEARRLCNQLGELEVKAGDFDRAVRAYVEQLAVNHKLVDLHPGDLGELRNLAACQERIGYVLEAQGRLPEAQSFYEQELAGIQELVSQHSTDNDLRYDLSVSYENLGGVLRAEGKPDSALPNLKRGLEIVQELAGQDAADKKSQRQMAICLENYGSTLADLERTPAALEAYDQSQQICETLVSEDPSNAGYERDLADCLGRAGDLLKADGNIEKAETHYQRCLQISESLVSWDETNQVRRQELALAFQRIAEARMLSDKPEEALGYYQASCDIFGRLLERNGSNASWREFLANGYLQAGKILLQKGKPDDAQSQFRRSEKLLQGLREANQLDEYGVTVLLEAEEALGKSFSLDGGVIAELRPDQGRSQQQ